MIIIIIIIAAPTDPAGNQPDFWREASCTALTQGFILSSTRADLGLSARSTRPSQDRRLARSQ